MPHPILRPPSSEEDNQSVKCWVCLATVRDDREAPWVQPCRCRGSAAWVHQSCLQRWIDEKQRGNSNTAVTCPKCTTEYFLIFPKPGAVIYTMDLVEKFINRVCPIAAGGVFLGSVYWSAVTYGAVTVMQILGHKEGLNVMETVDPLFLLIGLPTIPIMLILSKMVRWEDFVLRLWRKHSSHMPLLHYLFPDLGESRIPADIPPLSDPLSATRVLCGALFLPTFATFAGKIMFRRIRSNFQRTLLGGISFIALKGVMKIYFKQQQFVRQAKRTILNYEDAIRTQEQGKSCQDTPTSSTDELYSIHEYSDS